MPTTYEAIATVTVGSGGAASMAFTSIPGTYTDLLIKYSSRNGAAAVQNMAITLNSSTSSFTYRSLYGGGSVAPGSGSGSTNLVGLAQASNYTANTFDNGEIYIPNYAGSTNKSISADSVTETNASESYQQFFATLWSNTAAITSVSLAPTSGSFVQYSTATLYGIKNS